MIVRVGDLRTGRRIVDLPHVDASWTDELNTAESVDAEIVVHDARAEGLDLYNTTTPGKTFLVVEDEGIIAGGPIWSREYSQQNNRLKLSASGIWSYWDYRTLLPVVAASASVTNEDGTANTAYDTNLKNLSYETIAKRWIQQSMTWVGGNLPIVFEPDIAGSFEKNIVGAELKLIGDMLRDFTTLEDGVDIRFVPRRTADGLGYEWLMVCGHPRITSGKPVVWDATVPRTVLRGLSVKESAASMVGQAWTTGGKSAGEALIGRSLNSAVTDRGWPLLESVSSLSSSVTEQKTADFHAAELTRTGDLPTTEWSFEVRKDRELGRAYQAGFPCRIRLKGHEFIPDGAYDRRIMALSGSEKSGYVTVKTGEQYG